MGKRLDIGRLLVDCGRELGKLTDTQKDMVLDYTTFMNDFAEYLEEKSKRSVMEKVRRFIRGERDNDKEKMEEIKSEIGLSKADIYAVDMITLELNGIECRALDYGVIIMLAQTLMEQEEGFNLDRVLNKYGDPVKSIIESYYID